MKNKLSDLRNHLFATLEALQDQDKPMDLQRAKAIADVAQTVINSAKLEVDFLRTMDATPTRGGFFEHEEPPTLSVVPRRIGGHGI